MANKCQCGRDIAIDKEYCVFCDPAISPEQKADWRSRGGAKSRWTKHSIKAKDVLPISTSEDLLGFYNALLAEALEEEDRSRMIVQAMRIAPKLNDALIARMVELLNARVELIEAKKAGQVIDNTNLLGGGSNDGDFTDDSSTNWQD